MPVAFDHLCPKGTNLNVALTRTIDTLRDTAQSLQAAEDNDYPTGQLRAELDASRDRRKNSEVELHRHVAHCTDGCKRTAGQPNAAHIPRKNPHDAARPVLPGGGELAARIRAGDTVEHIAAEYDRTVAHLRHVIRTAGYSVADLTNTGDLHDLGDLDDTAITLAHTFRWEPWMAHGRCSEVDPDLWFPDKGGTTREAKAICSTCDVRAHCLNHALEYGERFGVWGGKSERERRALADTLTPHHLESA